MRPMPYPIAAAGAALAAVPLVIVLLAASILASAQPGADAGRLGGHERVEQMRHQFVGHAGATALSDDVRQQNQFIDQLFELAA